MVYYDKLQDLVDRKNSKSKGKSEETGSDNMLLIEIFEDKANLERKRNNYREAIGFQKDAIQIAELWLVIYILIHLINSNPYIFLNYLIFF